MENQKQYKIDSESQAGVKYLVERVGQDWFCSCPGFKFGRICKHIKKAQMMEDGELEKVVILNLNSPAIKFLRSDNSYRLEIDISGDGEQGIPQAEGVNKLLSWQGCEIIGEFRLKNK